MEGLGMPENPAKDSTSAEDSPCALSRPVELLSNGCLISCCSWTYESTHFFPLTSRWHSTSWWWLWYATKVLGPPSVILVGYLLIVSRLFWSNHTRGWQNPSMVSSLTTKIVSPISFPSWKMNPWRGLTSIVSKWASCRVSSLVFSTTLRRQPDHFEPKLAAQNGILHACLLRQLVLARVIEHSVTDS